MNVEGWGSLVNRGRLMDLVRRSALLRRVMLSVERPRAHDLFGLVSEHLRPEDRRILDIGAGTCLLTELIRDRTQADTTALDVQDFHLSTDLRPLLYDGSRIPFEDGSFDLAMILFVLHHAPAPNAAPLLKEARRVAKRVLIFEDVYTGLAQKYLNRQPRQKKSSDVDPNIQRLREQIIERIAAVNTTYFNGVGIERQMEEGKATVLYRGFQKVGATLPHVGLCQGNLETVRTHGVERWLAEQAERWRCPECGAPFSWYAETCGGCGRGLRDRAFRFSPLRSLIMKLGIRLARP